MQSSNPILTRVEGLTTGEPMTIKGAINKSFLLVGMASLIALAFFYYAAMTPHANNPAMLGVVVGGIGAFVLSLILVFKSNLAPTLALPLAFCEGLFMGGISAVYNAKYPGLPLTAIVATFVTAACLFGLYRARIIRATEKFKSIVISATLALAVLFVLQIVLSMFNTAIPVLFGTGPIAIAFAAFVAVIASLNLILDFDLIENGARMGLNKDFEWVAATALLITLVWMYVSILRLLGMLRDE